MTVKEAIYDVANRLGMTSDDANLSERQISQWLSVAASDLIPKYLRAKAEGMPDSMLKLIEGLPIQKTKGSFYSAFITLPYDVYDVHGVRLVLRPGGQELTHIGSLAAHNVRKDSTFGEVDEGWIRIQNKVYLKGTYPSNIKFDVLLVPTTLEAFEETDGFPAPEELYDKILERAEVIGGRQVGRPVDITDDGKHLNNG